MKDNEALLKEIADDIMDLFRTKYSQHPELFQIACATGVINTLLAFRPELVAAVYHQEDELA